MCAVICCRSDECIEGEGWENWGIDVQNTLPHFCFFSLVATVQNHVADVGKVEVEKWQEFVGDIWDKRLPHFRDFHGDGGMFLFDPRTGTYGFGDALEDDQRQLLDVLDDDIIAPDPPVGGNEDSTVNDSDEWEVVGSANDDESVSVDNCT